MEDKYDEHEKELKATSKEFHIPKNIKELVQKISYGVIGFWAIVTLAHLRNMSKVPSPDDLGITNLLIGSIIAIIIVRVPWNELGLKITKNGGIEFKDIVAAQATEHAEEIADLTNRIEYLEGRLESLTVTESPQMIKADDKTAQDDVNPNEHLRNLLISFLEKHKKWSFSPKRIQVWGVKQSGFTEISIYSLTKIRQTLQELVSEGVLETRISRKGNTLYRPQ